MKMTADLKNGWLALDGVKLPISNVVRTLREGTRASSEVVSTIPDGLPYDPRPFPTGTWKITGVEWQKEKGFDPRTFGPVKIITDAWQNVAVWELDEKGNYLRETARTVRDAGYLLHYSEFTTTLGCIRIVSAADAETLAKIVQDAWGRGEEVSLEVS